MNKKTISKFATLGLASVLVLPSTAAFADVSSTSNNNINQLQQKDAQTIKSSLEVFDKDGNLIKKYSDKEIADLQSQIPSIPNIPKIVEEAQEKDVQLGIVNTYSFDQNGILVDSSNTNVLEQQQILNQLASTYGIVYSFGSTSFNDSVWIKGGSTFYKPKSVILDPKNTVKHLAVRIYDSSSNYKGEVVAKGFSSETNIPFTHLTSSSGNYKIKLQNRDFYDVQLRGGHVFD